jgi:lipid-binding SYLF domain-containing protein
MADDAKSRPDRTSMEGMIWNANYVLEQALNPGLAGIPKVYFVESAAICIISLVEAGFIFSGNVGTGILMEKKEDGSWSTPVACGITGIGWGFMMGAALKDVIVFIPSKKALRSFFTAGLQVGGQANITIGTFGRDYKGAFAAGPSGGRTTLAISYSKGAFAGISLEGAVIAPRSRVNKKFYNDPGVTPEAILEGEISIPADKITMLEEVVEKLGKLAAGMTEVPGAAEKEKAEKAKAEADKMAEEMHEEEDVIQVDAKVEAEKEQK